MSPRPVVGRDLTRIRGVSDRQMSPDGTRVAFVVATASEEKDEYFCNVWVADVAGSEPRRFTTGPTRDMVPSRRRSSSSTVGRPRQILERYRIILGWFGTHLACDSERR